MTRETKIGLLVGLAFIIVIGVLLSDYIQSASQPEPANFVVTSQTLRQGIEVPGAIAPRPGPVQQPLSIEPGAVVATQDLLRAGTPPAEATIRIGPGQVPSGDVAGAGFGGAGHRGATESGGGLVIGPPAGGLGHTAPAPGTMALVPLQAEAPSTQTAALTPERSAEAELARLLVTPSPGGPGAAGGTQESAAARDGAAAAGGRTHVAVAGDTVYRLTQKYYGGYTPARAELIVRANPSMGGRADRIVVGQTYVIPPLPGETAGRATGASAATASASAATPSALAAAGGSGAAQASARTPSRTESRPAAASGGSPTYTVRAGDSLWRIADRAGVSVAELRQANRDVLRGSDVVRPGMVLRLPAASASGSAPPATAAAE